MDSLEIIKRLIANQEWSELRSYTEERLREEFAIDVSTRYMLEANNALAKINTGSAREGIRILSAYYEKGYRDEGLLVSLSKGLLLEGRKDEAILILESEAKKSASYLLKQSLGFCYQEAGMDRKAIEVFSEMLMQSQGDHAVHTSLSISLLRTGDYAKGFKEYEWRSTSWNLEWLKADWTKGTRIENKSVCIIADEGIGDAIMFSRYLSDVVRITSDHVVYCDKRIIELMRRSFPQVKLESQVLDNRYKDMDCRIRLGSLPYLFGESKKSVRRLSRYLKVSGTRRDWYKDMLSSKTGKRKIGIAWKGGLHSEYESQRRSIPIEQVAKIINRIDADWVSLQYGQIDEDISRLCQITSQPLKVIDELTVNIDEQAALIDALDIVITCEQTVAHIAGALGKRCFVLVGDPPGWRYASEAGNGRHIVSTMSWYESITTISRSSMGGDLDFFVKLLE